MDIKSTGQSLHTRYQITNKAGKIASNGGQTAQEFVISKGKNIYSFASVLKKRKLLDTDFSPSIIHRKKLRGLGGEIVFPTMETIEQIKEELLKKNTRWWIYCRGKNCTQRAWEINFKGRKT